MTDTTAVEQELDFQRIDDQILEWHEEGPVGDWWDYQRDFHNMREALRQSAPDSALVEVIVQDVCELPGDNDPEAEDTLILSLDDLRVILERNLTTPTTQAEPVSDDVVAFNAKALRALRSVKRGDYTPEGAASYLKKEIEALTTRPDTEVERLLQGMVSQLDHVGCTCTFPSDDCCSYAAADTYLATKGGGK